MSQHFGDLRSPEARPGPLHTAERGKLGRWLAHFDRQGLLLGITERSELVPYALIRARDPDDIQLEATWS